MLINSGAEWPNLREMAEISFERVRWPLCIWRVWPGEKISKAIVEAGKIYSAARERPAQFSFVRSIPMGAEEGVEVGEIMLIQADWVPDEFVAVGRGGSQCQHTGERAW